MSNDDKTEDMMRKVRRQVGASKANGPDGFEALSGMVYGKRNGTKSPAARKEPEEEDLEDEDED